LKLESLFLRSWDAVFEGVIGVNDDGGFTGDEGTAGDNWNDFIGVGYGLE
jgi:hypothetical protein